MPTDITLIKHKRGSAAALAVVNPILAEGEMCIKEDTLRFKFGDGVSAWNDLQYAVAEGVTGPTGPQGETGPTGSDQDFRMGRIVLETEGKYNPEFRKGVLRQPGCRRKHPRPRTSPGVGFQFRNGQDIQTELTL